MNESELKPCCGAQPRVMRTACFGKDDYWMIYCVKKCNRAGKGKTREQAVTAWNTRKEKEAK